MSDIAGDVFDVFQQVLGLPADADRGELVYNQYAGWDSVGHMTLVAALEERFDCMLDMQDILDMSSFAKCVEIMGKFVR
jgi:acyl carrier protein